MSSIESPLIGSGSQEEVDLRVQALLDLGLSRGYLTYDELNVRLPDEVVSPDGQQMTVTTTGMLETGQQVKESLVFRKQ